MSVIPAEEWKLGQIVWVEESPVESDWTGNYKPSYNEEGDVLRTALNCRGVVAESRDGFVVVTKGDRITKKAKVHSSAESVMVAAIRRDIESIERRLCRHSKALDVVKRMAAEGKLNQ